MSIKLSTSPASTPSLNSVAYSNGIYVTVGVIGRIYRSTDTIVWIPRTENPNNFNTYAGTLSLNFHIKEIK